MKAIFYNYQTPEEERSDIFESEIYVIPNIGDNIAFPFENSIHFADVVSITHCFGLDAKFSHIDIELDEF